MRESDIQRIREIIEEVKSGYTTYGGDVEFLDVVDDKVRIKTTGYCHR
jgi:Fe-S cluster biogenesis protein NfuA